MVEALGTVAASIAIAERNGASITCLNHRQPPQGPGLRLLARLWEVNNLLSRKGLADKLRATLGDPLLCFTTTGILLLHIRVYYYTLWHTWLNLRALAWPHSRTRRRCTCAQQALPVHQYYSLYHGALLLRPKYVHTLLNISSNSSTAASERFFFFGWKWANFIPHSVNISSLVFQRRSIPSCILHSRCLVPCRHVIMSLDVADYISFLLWHWCRYSGQKADS